MKPCSSFFFFYMVSMTGLFWVNTVAPKELFLLNQAPVREKLVDQATVTLLNYFF